MVFDFDNHIHTIYSGHSAPGMTASNIIKNCERVGLKQIAITEHSFDWHLGPSGNIQLIKKELANITSNINVAIGMEIDPDPDVKNMGRLNFEDFDKGDIYPVLTGFHGYPGVNAGWFENVYFTRRDKNRIYSRWLKMIEKLIENPKVDILAHLGRIVMQNGIIKEFSGRTLKDFENLALAAKQYNVAFELNETLLNSIPTERLQKSYKNVFATMLVHDVKLSIGSDAHKLDAIGHFEKVSEFIKPFNINKNNFLTITQGEQNETEVHAH